LVTVLACPRERNRWRAGLQFALAVGLAFACSGGIWLAELWHQYGNPTFPYYNDIFASPYAALRDFAFHRCRPSTLGDALAHPFRTATVNQLAIEQPFRDARYAILCVAGLALLAARMCRAQQRARIPPDGTLNLVLWFYISAYVIWLSETAYLRYAPALELLAPVLTVALLLRLLPGRRAAVVAVLALGATVALVQSPRRNGRQWTAEHFGVRAPAVPAGDVLGVLVGDEPNSYFVPFFPPRVRFVRLESNYQAPFGDTEMKRAIRRVIEQHRGPIFLLSFAHRRAQDVAILAKYGLELGNGPPAAVPSAVGLGGVWRPLARCKQTASDTTPTGR
jgi:hypothetical protein